MPRAASTVQTGSIIQNNVADAGDGGGIYTLVNTTIAGSTITANSATDSTTGEGGGIFPKRAC